MKGLQIAVLLVLCISFAEALRCNCVYMIGGLDYINTKQTCRDEDSVCVFVTGKLPAFGKSFHYRRCMKSSHASGLKNIEWLRVNICNTDLCN